MTSLCLLSVLLLVGTSNLAAGAKDYKLALKKSILFYEAQRSGPISDQIIPWRHSSAMHDCTVGGWYDAGDHVKFGLPMASSAHLLMWGLYEFKDGYVEAGQLNQMYHMLKTPLNYFKAAWNAHAHKLTAQVGDAHADHAYWGRPEDMTMSRPCVYIDNNTPGSNIAGETAASLALGYLVFKQKDPNYANGLLSSAKSLYAFAKAHPGSFTGSGGNYRDGGYKDEMCLGAVWLYRATKDSNYLNDAKSFYEAGVPWALSWGDKKPACQFLLFQEGNTGYKNDVVGFLNQFLPGGNVKQLPCGLACRDDWGSNRYAGNAAFLALLAAKENINPTPFRKFAVEQINYILGDNHINGGCFSFEIGYGSKFPRKPHHRGASCPTHGPCNNSNKDSPVNSPQILQGAVVGGPDRENFYADSRTDYKHNEVATDYNSGFQGALAGIISLQQHHQMPSVRTDCQCKN